jgi:type IV secretion system protein VirD4
MIFGAGDSPMSAEFTIPYGYAPRRKTFLSYPEDRHLITFGPTRSGKGATVIGQALLEWPGSAIIVDMKGQNAAITGRHRRAMGQDVFFLNPFGLHAGEPWKLPKHRYNPLAHLDINNPNIVADARALGQAAIITQGREPYFDDTARDLFSTTALHLVATQGAKATLGGVRNAITAIGARSKEAAELIAAMSNSPHDFVRQPIGRFKDVEARDISSAINTAITQTAFLDDPALTDPARHGTLTDSDFNMMQLKEKPTTVYLILPGHYMSSYSRFLRIIITSALDQLTSRPGGLPVLIILDEFARMQQLDAVSEAFGFAAGFNVQLWPFLQDLPQLEAVYGKMWMSILANCGMAQFFTPVDVKTAEYLQRRGGMMTGLNRSRSVSGAFGWGNRSSSLSDHRVSLLPFERMMNMPQRESVVFFAGAHDPLIAPRVPYWEIPRLAGRFDPDPYHL